MLTSWDIIAYNLKSSRNYVFLKYYSGGASMSEEKFSQYIRLHITPSLFAWLKEEAKYCDMSFGAFCRAVLEQYRREQLSGTVK